MVEAVGRLCLPWLSDLWMLFGDAFTIIDHRHKAAEKTPADGVTRFFVTVLNCIIEEHVIVESEAHNSVEVQKYDL